MAYRDIVDDTHISALGHQGQSCREADGSGTHDQHLTIVLKYSNAAGGYSARPRHASGGNRSATCLTLRDLTMPTPERLGARLRATCRASPRPRAAR